jgi:shikimate kinase
MGSGKSTIGKKLAKRLQYSFVDLDMLIEGKQLKSVSRIFAENGEQEFRMLEKKYLHEIANSENVVISTGGGTPCFFDNMEFMNSRGLTIYLKLSPTELAERLEATQDNKRPLLAEKKGNKLIRFIEEGLKMRESFYCQANFTVKGNDRTIISRLLKLI